MLKQNLNYERYSALVPDQGYWKVNNESDVVYYCLNKPENCNSDMFKFYCIKGQGIYTAYL